MECKCLGCRHMKGYRWPGNKRAAYHCVHPDQQYIEKYFRESKLKSMPGFLGYGEVSLPRKRTPKWCPLQKPESPKEENADG